MPKKKAVSEDSATFTQADEQTSFDVLAMEEVRPKRERRNGVYIPLTDDGTLDEGRVKDASKLEQVRRALGSSTGAVEAQAKAGMEVSVDFVRGIYSGVEHLLSTGGTLFLKWPRDLTVLMRYSPEQKDKLIPPTKAVLEKLAPSWLIKHQEVATLAVVFTAVTQEMVQGALVQYIAKHGIPEPPEPPKSETAHVDGNALPQVQ